MEGLGMLSTGHVSETCGQPNPPITRLPPEKLIPWNLSLAQRHRNRQADKETQRQTQRYKDRHKDRITDTDTVTVTVSHNQRH